MSDVDRIATVYLAYKLIHDIQAGLPGAAEELAHLAEQARDAGWGEVERSCIFGEAVRSWIAGDGRTLEPVNRLIKQSQDADDEVLLAVGLALRSDEGFFGQDLTTGAERDEDLAQAVVLLEKASQAPGRPCERITGHTAAAIAFGNRWLFELSHEQYGVALAIGEGEPPGTVDFLLAPILFNLAEEQVSWASKLRQLGDEPSVHERLRAWEKAAAATSTYPMAESWQIELDSLGVLLRAIAGQDTETECQALLATLERDGEGEPRAIGLLRLARALNLADIGHEGADAATEAAISSLSPTVFPFTYDLALYLAATLEARSHSSPGLRYARRMLEEQWARRDGALGSMQVHIEAKRLAIERDLLSRHARLDDLTGIANRRSLEEFVADLGARGVHESAVILFDVDGFKEVNDRFGHPAGDEVLVRIASVIDQGIRPSDLAVRLGGDEFAVVLTDVGLEAATNRAKALLDALEDQRMGHIGDGVVLRVSAGVAAGPPSEMPAVRGAADAALYEAKAAGGHCVRSAPHKGGDPTFSG